jgi:hypothetical protein
MSNDDPFMRLWDFVHWVRKRRTFRQDAPVDGETLEFVTQGVERFLDGKEPWAEPQKEKAKRKRGRPVDPDTPDLMWKCYYMACVINTKDKTNFLPQYCDKYHFQGAFDLVGTMLNLSTESVGRYAREARKRVKSKEGENEYHQWLTQRLSHP